MLLGILPIIVFLAFFISYYRMKVQQGLERHFFQKRK